MNGFILNSWFEKQVSIERLIEIIIHLHPFAAPGAEFSECNAIAVAFKIIIATAFMRIYKDFSAAVLPAWITIICTLNTKTGWMFVDIKTKGEHVQTALSAANHVWEERMRPFGILNQRIDHKPWNC